MTSRLAVGTVQFGLPYGVANQAGQVSQGAAEAILMRAFAAGVDTLDTAVAYGTSEACLGRAGVSSWRVITKLPALPADATDVEGWVRSEVHGSLQRLSIPRLDGLLLHKPADLLGPAGGSYQQALQLLKQEGVVRSVGISIYDPAELDSVCSCWQPDIVQAPFNVLDRRLLSSGWLARLVERGVRIHVRSVFLQGLLLLPSERRPAWFDRWRPLLDRWIDWCREQQTSPLRAALAFAQAQPGIERLVVGLDSVAQLDEILAALAADTSPAPDDLYSDDLDLLEPSRWELI